MNDIELIKKQLKESIIELFSFNITPEDICDDMMISGGGLYLDSNSTIRLVVELEQKFEIAFDNEDLFLEGNNTIAALAGYIFQKQAANKAV